MLRLAAVPAPSQPPRPRTPATDPALAHLPRRERTRAAQAAANLAALGIAVEPINRPASIASPRSLPLHGPAAWERAFPTVAPSPEERAALRCWGFERGLATLARRSGTDKATIRLARCLATTGADVTDPDMAAVSLLLATLTAIPLLERRGFLLSVEELALGHPADWRRSGTHMWRMACCLHRSGVPTAMTAAFWRAGVWGLPWRLGTACDLGRYLARSEAAVASTPGMYLGRAAIGDLTLRRTVSHYPRDAARAAAGARRTGAAIELLGPCGLRLLPGKCRGVAQSAPARVRDGLPLTVLRYARLVGESATAVGALQAVANAGLIEVEPRCLLLLQRAAAGDLGPEARAWSDAADEALRWWTRPVTDPGWSGEPHPIAHLRPGNRGGWVYQRAERERRTAHAVTRVLGAKAAVGMGLWAPGPLTQFFADYQARALPVAQAVMRMSYLAYCAGRAALHYGCVVAALPQLTELVGPASGPPASTVSFDTWTTGPPNPGHLPMGEPRWQSRWNP